MPCRVAVVGASGYTGAELIRLILGHPNLELSLLCAGKSAGQRVADVYPHLVGHVDQELRPADPDAIATSADVAMLGLPHGQSARLAAELLDRGMRVVDLSADFRLRDSATYEQWYGEHGAPQRQGDAVYGLPERYRDDIAGAKLVACPGCYPTSAILAAAPLLAAGLIEPDCVIVDAKSGVSGAGRKAKLASHFPEVGEGVRAYAVAGLHRHTPEIEQELACAAESETRVLFTPHLIPMSRGIFACVYGQPTDSSRPEADYRRALDDAYGREPFVQVVDGIPDTAFVRGSNCAHLSVRFDERTCRVLAMSAIDNLVKGAAGQAVQCLNLMLDLDERQGLETPALFP